MFAAAVVCAMACAATHEPAVAPPGPPHGTPRLVASELPSLERGKQHVTGEIMPFWLTKDALGTPASIATIWRAVKDLDVTVKKNGTAVRTRSA